MSVHCTNITKLNDTVVSLCTKPFPFVVYNNIITYGMKNWVEHFIYWYSRRNVLVISKYFYWSCVNAFSTLVVSKPNQLCQSICQQAETIIMNPIVLFPANPTNYYTEFVQVLLWLLQTKFLVYDLSSPFRTFMFCTNSTNFITYIIMAYVKI